MPLTKSAKKSYRVSEKKRAHNLELEIKLKKALKKVDKNNVNETISLLDKTAKRHVISRGRADRLKSRLGKKFDTEKSDKKASTKTEKKSTIKKTVSKPKTIAKK